MKKNLIAAAVLLFATVGAFATAKNLALDVVYYEDPINGCTQVFATKCANIGTPQCQTDVFDAENELVASGVQIYRDLVSGQCENAYRP